MSDKLLKLEVITPDKTVVSDMVSYVKVPAGLGSLGILPDHAPLMTSLDIGILEYTKKGDEKRYQVTIAQGYLQLLNNEISVLVKSAERSEDIDLNRAEAAKERAEKLLNEHPANLDVERAKSALKRALNRISVKTLS